MEVFESIAEFRKWRSQWAASTRIGLVATMGALHHGHASLVTRARRECDLVVATVFVNKLQFNNEDDYTRYPVTRIEDIERLEISGCDAVLIPTAADMYPKGVPSLTIDFGVLGGLWEGARRPGHFNGVGIVVSKLLNIVAPTHAYFGQKDLQQLRIIQMLVSVLGFQVEIVPCETVREADGLASSSRNTRLSPEARSHAPILYKGLLAAATTLPNVTGAGMMAVGIILQAEAAIEIDYLAIVHPETLLPVSESHYEGDAAIIVAASLNGVRLIDNLLVTGKTSDRGQFSENELLY
jgi:pantoate--beta-alanine ligase